jgi:pimeloyl-ACP methyl ester carboxylesterase
MKQFSRLGAALVVFLLFQTTFFHVNGQVLTARFKSITPNTKAYYEYLPKGYSATDTTRYPLLIHLIGAGDLGTGTASTITLLLRSGPVFEISSGVFPDPITVNGKTFGFIVIDPQFMIQPTVTDVNSTINYAIANYHVDTTRIYLTGLSMGGGVTWTYAGNQPAYANRLAAIVPVCGDVTPDLGRARIIAASNLPVWATHNNNDPEVPAAYTAQEIAYINEPPAPVPPAMETVFNNDVHDAWTATYTPTLSVNNMNIYQWMLQYTRLSATGNNPPVVTAGAAQSITNPASTATLTGSATDSLGTITSHVWTFVSGPTTPTIASPTSYMTAVSGLTVAGTYIFSLSVTDNRNLTVATNAQINVFPPPTGPNQLINVSLYSFSNPYVNSAWNDWNMGSGSLSSGKFNYTNGNPSNLSAVLSAQTAVSDNGTNYVTVTMCPEQVARYASYYSGSGGRTLTINGLDSTKLYRLDFYATRVNPQQTTTFATAGTSVTVSTNDNTGQVGTIDNLTPVNGKIVVTMTHGQYYDYLNGFTVTEKTIVSSAPPVASAGPDQKITLPLDSVTLNGTASKGANPIVSYQWTILSGAPAPGALESPTSPTTILTGVAAGVYNVQLKVTDDSNHIGLDTVKITVNPAPLPVAHAGPDQAITLPLDSVALDGSTSTGSFLAYQWTILSGPGGGLTSPSTAKTELDNLGAGIYLVGLTVTDIANHMNTDTVKITVNSAPPPPAPIANAGPDLTITLPTNSVTLSGAASTAKDTIVTYRWTMLTGNSGILTTPDSVITTVTGLTAGTYMIQLQVTDDRSQSGLDTVQVTVNPAPPPPPPLANAGPDQSITLPVSSVTLNGLASTGKDSIVSYQWTVLSGPAGDTLTAPDSVVTYLTSLRAGTYQVRLQVTDDSSLVGLDTVIITVNSPAIPLPPQVTVGSNQTITTTTTSLTSTVTAPQNLISSKQWTKVSAPGQRIMHIGVIGSSTMYGVGPTNIDSSLVNRLQRYYKANGIIDTIYNLAVAGSTVYNGVTADFVSPGAAPNLYDSTANVTAALAKGIDVLIVGYPSNEYEIGQLTIPEIMAAHQNIFNAATKAGVKCYITTTQPRTSSFDSADQAQLLVIGDSLLNRFGKFCIDFMTPMVYPGTYTVLPQYSAGDGIHLSSAAHAQLAAIVEATNPFQYMVSDSSVIVSPATTTTAVTGVDSGVHKYQMGAFGQYKLASSAIISVTYAPAKAPPPPVPVANAGPDQTITLPATTATLDGSSSETGGKIVSHIWTQTAGTAAIIASPTSDTTNITGLNTAGIYSFVLTVTDSLGATASDTAKIIVDPQPLIQNKLINVAIYGFSDPYNNSAWNAWNLGGALQPTGLLKYSDGTTSAISAALSTQTAVADNGVNYATVTMCPEQAARFPSYYSGSGGRTLTLSGLDSTKTYSIALYATRVNPSQTTTFAIGAVKVTISTNDNTSSVATFSNLTPATGGKLVVTLTHSQYYDYINGFSLTETTVTAPTAVSTTEITSLAPTITPDTSSLFNQPLAVYPNPTKGSFELHVNNANTGRMKVDIFTAGGVLMREIVIAKTTSEMDTPLSLEGLQPGDYFLVATVGTWRRALKLVKL